MPIDQAALERARAAWIFRGQQRPAFAHVPGAGQESVWDYPRPPLYVRDARPIEIHAGTRCLARSDASIYGGWITAEIVGPFKGEPGTGHW